MKKTVFFLVAIFISVSYALAINQQEKVIARLNSGLGGSPPGSIAIEDYGSLTESSTSTSGAVTDITVLDENYNLLLVVVAFNNEGAYTVSSVYWDVAGANEIFTSIASYVGGTDSDDARVEAFYLIDPTPGVNKTVTVNFSGDLVYGCSVGVYSLSGVAQTDPVRDYDGVGTTSDVTPTSVTLTTVAGDFIAIGFTIEDPVEDFNFTGSGFTTTELFDSDDTHNSWAVASGVAGDASELCEVAWDTTNHTALIAVAIKVAT